jgi:hypothetical protein
MNLEVCEVLTKQFALTLAQKCHFKYKVIHLQSKIRKFKI